MPRMPREHSDVRPTLESVESMLERYIDLARNDDKRGVTEKVELLAKLHLDLLLATRGLGSEEQERARFLFLRLQILEGRITACRQLELFRCLKED